MNQILNQQAIIKKNFSEMEENLLRLKTFLEESGRLLQRWKEKTSRIVNLENSSWILNGVVVDPERINALLSLKNVAEKQALHYETVLVEGDAILKTMSKRYEESKNIFEKFSVYNSLNSLEALSHTGTAKPSLESDKLALLIQESRYIAHTTEAFMELEVGKKADPQENSEIMENKGNKAIAEDKERS